jgi:hypothetical protein
MIKLEPRSEPTGNGCPHEIGIYNLLPSLVLNALNTIDTIRVCPVLQMSLG